MANIVNLVMGDDAKCVWCQDPRAFTGDEALPSIPYDLCPTHYGVFHDDPEMRSYTTMEIPEEKE